MCWSVGGMDMPVVESSEDDGVVCCGVELGGYKLVFLFPSWCVLFLIL